MKCFSASGDTQIPWQKSGSETVLNSTAKLPAGYAEPLTRHTRSMSTRSFFTWAPDRALPIAVSLDFDFAESRADFAKLDPAHFFVHPYRLAPASLDAMEVKERRMPSQVRRVLEKHLAGAMRSEIAGAGVNANTDAVGCADDIAARLLAHPAFQAAQAELAKANLDVEYLAVRASMDGAVSKLPKPGQYLAAGATAATLAKPTKNKRKQIKP